MASELDLDAIEQRASAATEGRWEVKLGHVGSEMVWFFVRPNCDGIRAWTDQDHIDFEFAAHARQDIPALVKRVRELERIVEESVVSGSELVVGQYVLIREKLAYDEYGYTATAINGTHRPTSLEPKLDLWEAAEQARRWSMFPPPDICAEKGLADGK